MIDEAAGERVALRVGERVGEIRVADGTERGDGERRVEALGGKRVGNYFLNTAGEIGGEGAGALLAVVGEDPDMVVAAGRAKGGAVKALDGSVDAFERPVGEAGAGAAAVGELVVAEEVDVNDGQAARDVDLAADGDEFAQADADERARDDHAEFL